MASGGGDVIHQDVRGVVTWFNIIRRYGFIASEVGDVFVHISGLLNCVTLERGQVVKFDVLNARRGPQAVNVLLLEDDGDSVISGGLEDDLNDILLPSLFLNPFGPFEAFGYSSPSTTEAESTSESCALDEDKSGFDTSRFEGVIPEELICTICQGVLFDPVQTACEHLFCRHCIEEWLSRQKVCPLDRESLHDKPNREVPRYLKRILGGLKLRCSNAANGCDKVVKLDELENHMSQCAHAKPIAAIPTAVSDRESTRKVTSPRRTVSDSTNTANRSPTRTTSASTSSRIATRSRSRQNETSSNHQNSTGAQPASTSTRNSSQRTSQSRQQPNSSSRDRRGALEDIMHLVDQLQQIMWLRNDS